MLMGLDGNSLQFQRTYGLNSFLLRLGLDLIMSLNASVTHYVFRGYVSDELRPQMDQM